jgi:hypothetical protein
MMATERKQILYSLIFNCPFELHCENCPLKHIYQQEIEDRLDFIENLPTLEIERITDYDTPLI